MLEIFFFIFSLHTFSSLLILLVLPRQNVFSQKTSNCEIKCLMKKILKLLPNKFKINITQILKLHSN